MRSKHLLLSAILLFAASTLTAQMQKGNTLLGGSLSFSTSNFSTGTQKFTSVFTSIKAGKFITARDVIGVGLLYGHSKAPGFGIYTNEYDQYAGGLFYRRYFPLATKLYFVGESDAFYNSGLRKEYSNGSKIATKQNGGTISLVPGVAYAILKKFQVELLAQNIFSLNYQHTRSRSTSTDTGFPGMSETSSNSFYTNLNLDNNFLSNLAIGFKFIL